MFNLGRKQKGLSLVEALIVLGILASVIAAIALNAEKANVKKSIQEMNQEIFQIFDGVQEVFGDDGTTGLTNITATELGIKPATIRGNGATWRHSFEGQYTVTAISGEEYGFQLVASNIPRGEPCAKLIGAAKKANWTGIVATSTPTGTPVSTANGGWSPADIATACSQLTTTVPQNIIFSYIPTN